MVGSVGQRQIPAPDCYTRDLARSGAPKGIIRQVKLSASLAAAFSHPNYLGGCEKKFFSAVGSYVGQYVPNIEDVPFHLM